MEIFFFKKKNLEEKDTFIVSKIHKKKNRTLSLLIVSLPDTHLPITVHSPNPT